MRAIFFLSLTLIFILSISLTSAVEVQLKYSFNQGETLLAKISGSFLEPFSTDNLFFYRGHVQVPMELHLAKISGEYYLYAPLLGKEPGNYSLVIKNIQYMKSGQSIEEEITTNFTISDETAIFTIDPGFKSTNDSFTIEVQNLQDHTITLSTTTSTLSGESTSSGWDGFFSIFSSASTPEESSGSSSFSTQILSGQEKKLYITVGDFTEDTLKQLTFSSEGQSYTIPVYVIKNAEPSPINNTDTDQINQTSNVTNQTNVSIERIEFSEQELNLTIMSNSTNNSKTIYLNNTGTTTLQNITLSISSSLLPYIQLSSNFIETLESNSSAKIRLSVSAQEQGDFIEGQLKAKTLKGEYIYLPITLNITESELPEDYPTNLDPPNKTDTPNDDSDDDDVDSATRKKIIGWTILLGVAVFLGWFFLKKYRGTENTFSFSKILEKK